MNITQDPREAQLSDILYCIGMESQEAYYHMEMLCSELKIPYPPKKIKPVRSDYITSNDNPPIPVRQFDWSATTKDYEPDDPVGRGATEQEAIADLDRQLSEYEEINEQGEWK